MREMKGFIKLNDEDLKDITGGGGNDDTYPMTVYCPYCKKDVYFESYQERMKHESIHATKGDVPQ